MGIIEHRKSVINVICPNCKEEVVDSKLAFCVMCGFKLKGGAKAPGFFTKSPETGVSKADEYAAKTRKAAKQAEAEKPAPPEPAPVPQQAAPVPQEPVPQQAVPQPGMPQMQGMMPQQGMPQMQQGMMPQPGMPQMQQGMMSQPGMPQMQQGMMPQPGMPQMQQGMMPQPGMPQMQGMMPQQGMPQMQGMMPQQEGVDPQQNPMQPQMMGMQPQMMGMQPMMGMPQFMGYDPNGNPIYVQMMPQMVGYDAYGNPMYTMVPMQSYGMPQAQMQGMMPQPGMPPMQGMMPQQGMPQMQGVMPQQGMAQPQMQGVMPQQTMPQPPLQPAPPPAAPVQEVPQAPVQENVVRTSDYYSEMPVSAEALMNEDENAEPPAPPADMPNEADLLNQIFSDKPKQHTMSTGTVASAQTFSISLSANEITSVGEEKPAAAPQAQPAAAPAEKPEKPKKAPKPAKADKKSVAKPEKKPIKVISPDEFFDDNRNKPQRMVGVRVVEELDDEQMEDKLAAMEGKKKSRRSMMAADKNVDPEAALENPAVEAAAQAILDEESAIDAMNAMQQRLAELQKNPNRKKDTDPNLPLEASWPDQQPPMTMNS